MGNPLHFEAGKYGKKISASFGKFLGHIRVLRIKGDGLQSSAEKMRGGVEYFIGTRMERTA
jgi:hypothetical protein